MIVYRPHDESVRLHALFVSPGSLGHTSSDFMEGDRPKLFKVEFVYGKADVPSGLGRYLIDTGQAQTTRLLLPPEATLRGRHAGQNAG